MDLAALKKHLARNLSRDEADPRATYVKPITRESDIRRWIDFVKGGDDREDYALALASLVAEQSKESPAAAIATWEANRTLIKQFQRAEAVANWGLGRAYDNLD